MGGKNVKKRSLNVQEPPQLGHSEALSQLELDSGLDPVEQYGKTGYFAGLMINMLLTRSLRTKNPVALALMFIAGLGGILYIIPVIIFHHAILILAAIPILIGFMLMINFVINIRRIIQISHQGGKHHERKHPDRHYRHPKSSA